MQKIRLFKELAGDPPPIAALKHFAATDTEADRVKRRRTLMADAWRRGHRDITVLAAAASVSRPTVYADLRAFGVDTDDTTAPVLPTRPMPEPVLVDQLRLACLAALTALADETAGIQGNSSGDVNPHTNHLSARELTRIFATPFRDRQFVDNRGTLGDLRYNILIDYFDQSTKDEQARWAAWELRRLGANADAESFERLIGRSFGDTFFIFVLAPDWDTLVLYREDDDVAWALPRELTYDGVVHFDYFTETVMNWDAGKWEPQESGLRTLPAPTPAELDPDPGVRAQAEAAHGGPGSDRRPLRLLARWTFEDKTVFTEGAAADIDHLGPQLRRFFGTTAYMLGADGTVTEIEPYRLDPTAAAKLMQHQGEAPQPTGLEPDGSGKTRVLDRITRDLMAQPANVIWKSDSPEDGGSDPSDSDGESPRR